MKKDALGNDIVIGGIYGYSRNANGFTTSTIGTVVVETPKAVTMHVIRQTRALYNHDPEVINITKDHVTCKAAGLLPIDMHALMIAVAKQEDFLEALKEYKDDHYKHFECYPMDFEYKGLVYDDTFRLAAR